MKRYEVACLMSAPSTITAARREKASLHNSNAPAERNYFQLNLQAKPRGMERERRDEERENRGAGAEFIFAEKQWPIIHLSALHTSRNYLCAVYEAGLCHIWNFIWHSIHF